jgi:hypothetical protein
MDLQLTKCGEQFLAWATEKTLLRISAFSLGFKQQL